jgi:hypothetical protein
MTKTSSNSILQGDRCQHFGGGKGTITAVNKGLLKYEVRWDSGKTESYTQKEFSKWCETLPPEPGTEDIEEEEANLWSQFAPADFSRESEDSPEQLSLLGDLIGESQLNTTKMRSQSFNQTSIIEFLGETSESFTFPLVNTISLLEDSPALTPAEPETELELLTYLQSLEQCSESSSESLERPDPSLSFWSNLRDLNIEDLERGLEDCEWEDIKASIQSSRVRMNLARTSRGKDYLSFHTLLAGHGGKHRDVGLTECEKWWKKHVIQAIGSQLSSEAIALLHGFPANWFRSISPPSVAIPDTQDDSQAENSEARLSLSLKHELPLNASSGYGEKSPHLHNFTGDKDFPFKKGDILTCDFYSGRELEVTEELDHPGRVGVKFVDGGRSGKTFYTDKIACHLLTRGNQSVKEEWKIGDHCLTDQGSGMITHIWGRKATIQLNRGGSTQIKLYHLKPTSDGPADYSLGKPETLTSTKTEEELTPTDDRAVGKHFWCDRLTVAVEVLTVHNWRETPKSTEIIKGARCRPWWNKDCWGNNFPEYLVLALDELVEIEKFSSPLKQLNSLEKSESPINPLTGISPNSDSPVIGSSPNSYQGKQTGSLYQYTANKQNKAGATQTYPKVEGDRKREEDSHWYWGFSYVEKSGGKWRDKSAAIPRKKLSAVRAALREQKPYSYILQEVLGKD